MHRRRLYGILKENDGGMDMKTIFWKVTALCLAASLLLSGCAFFSLESLQTVPFEDMEYQRPDVTALEQAMEDCRQSAPGDAPPPPR